MSRQPRIAGTLSKIALEAKAQTGKAAQANCAGRQQSKKEPSGIPSEEKTVPMLQKQLLHKYISVSPPKKKKIRRRKKSN